MRHDRARNARNIAAEQSRRIVIVAALPSTRILTTPCAARRSAKGSFEPVGTRPTREASAQRVQLVGESYNPPFVRGRNRVIHAQRLVMFVDGLGDGFRFALGLRVKAADDALQIGELLHHFGGQVGFA